MSGRPPIARVAFGLRRMPADRVRQAVWAVAARSGLADGVPLLLHDAGPAGVWVFGDARVPRALAEATAIALGRAIRWYASRIVDGRLHGEGFTFPAQGPPRPIADAAADAPVVDAAEAEAEAWLAIRLEVAEGLDDHDARRERLVWRGPAG